MAAVSFDTLKFAETLKDSGFDETQAKGMANAIQEAQATHLEELATKADIREVKGEIEAVELRLNAQLLLLKWMLGAIIAGVLSLVLKTFF